MGLRERIYGCYRPSKIVGKPPDIMSDDRIFLAWQRSHMANERTFLSWSRTSISLLAFGFVIEKFELFMHHLVHLTGETAKLPVQKSMVYLSLFSFAMAGIAILISGWRFLAVRRHIDRGEASFSILPDVLAVFSVIVIIVMTLALSFPRLLEIGGM